MNFSICNIRIRDLCIYYMWKYVQVQMHFGRNMNVLYKLFINIFRVIWHKILIIVKECNKFDST